MTARNFVGESRLVDDALTLALAPGLAVDGPCAAPSFFHGFATHPQVVARALVTLADIAATRYFRHEPVTARDPVLTAHGDRLRAECFSACNSVYARLDLLQDGLDGGEIGRGTTNVDLSAATRRALANVGRSALLHLDVGTDGFTLSTLKTVLTERPVKMPDRWVRALGNVAELHRGMRCEIELDAAATKAFLATVPGPTATGRAGWLVPTRDGVRFTARSSAGAVHVSGLHRLAATRRLMPHARGATFYADRENGASLIELELPAARLSIGLTDASWRGHSGEGSLLEGLAGAGTTDTVALVAAVLVFEPVIDVTRLVRATGLDAAGVRSALTVLAASGRVGWDARAEAYFHRELPDELSRTTKHDPRLVAARRLAERGAVRRDGERWRVRSGDDDYLVRLSPASCTCTWFLRHGTSRGPCRHVLAARLGDSRGRGAAATGDESS